jgi:hypothetical protein
MRLAAFLNLVDARGFAVLAGPWGAHADHIRALSDAPLVLVNPSNAPVPGSATVIRTRGPLPFAANSARGAALSADSSAELIRSCVRTVRSGGRLVAPAALPLPPDVAELVRDDALWVGEKTAALSAPRLVSIGRSRS